MHSVAEAQLSQPLIRSVMMVLNTFALQCYQEALLQGQGAMLHCRAVRSDIISACRAWPVGINRHRQAYGHQGTSQANGVAADKDNEMVFVQVRC